ncbi:MAG: type I secretion system permease/ATPase [Rhizobiaceae bacterium]
MKNLTKATRSFRNSLLLIGGFSLFAAILQLTMPLYMLQIYDRVLPSQSTDTLIFISILAGFALIILGITEMIRQILGTRAAAKLDTVLSEEVLQKVIRNGHTTGGNIQPLRDLQTVRSLVGSKILIGVVDLPFATIFIACMYLIHPNLFWLVIGGTVILVIIAMMNLSFAAKSSADQANAAATANRQSEFFARNSDSIISMGMMNDIVASWGNWNAESLVSADQSSRINSIFSGISRTIRFGMQAAMLGFGAYLVQLGEMTAGMVFASSILSGRALQPIDVVINSWPQISNGRRAWSKVREYVENSPQQEKYTQMAEPIGHLSVKDILQTNPVNKKNPPILNRVSFELEAGKSVAVVGPSGSGKSTLARIIVGAFRPFAGEVRIDGHNIMNWEPGDLGRHIGYLAQDVELLPGTIAQNISRFRPDADDEMIRKAATMAHVEDLIKKMPNGYDTVIGPGGLAISGGEKQRIALARAFFGMPKLLVLDEPNSSLDKLGENALLRALVEARHNGITVFLVTQRENIIKYVDKIMRMQDGKIVDYDDRDVIVSKQAKLIKEALAQKNKAQQAVSGNANPQVPETATDT